MEGSGASAEGKTSGLGGSGWIPGERRREEGAPTRVDMRRSPGTQETFFGNIFAGL